MKENGISAVVNTCNSASTLRRTLASLRGFDQIVVVDMESTDGTRDIAAEFGAKTVVFPKGDINIVEPARDTAIRSADCGWVLVVDSDEAIPDGLRQYLYDYIAGDGADDALALPFTSVFMGRRVRGHSEYHVRFFRRDKASWPPEIHSHVRISGTTGRVPQRPELCVMHYDNPTMHGRIEKINRYSDNEVSKRLGRRYSTASLLLRPAWFFFKSLILKGGFRDGRRGLFRAYMDMFYQAALLGKHFEQTHPTDDTL